MTFDTDVAVRANGVAEECCERRLTSPSQQLVDAIGAIRAGATDSTALQSLSMSASSMIASTSALKRARNVGKLGKGGKGMMKRSAQRTAGILAMRAAAAAAVTGALDGVHGADPFVVEMFRGGMANIFHNHGATRLRSPLMRPRHAITHSLSTGGPAEVVNSRGVVLVLPEDLTAPFGTSSFSDPNCWSSCPHMTLESSCDWSRWICCVIPEAVRHRSSVPSIDGRWPPSRESRS